MGFADTHAHLLPFWDDGADSWETALAMLEMGEEDGIDTVVCTPHIMSPRDSQEEPVLWATYEELVERAQQKNLKLTIHMGAEFFVNPDIDLNRKMATPAQNGRYYLVEFPMNMMPDFVAAGFLKKCQTGQRTPVLAHPERYLRVLQNPQEACTYVERGALLQVNAGSLLGVFGTAVREVAMQLLQAGLVHVIASDAHDLKTRPLRLRKAYDLVAAEMGTEKAIQLFSDNPRRLLRGEDIVKQTPLPLKAPAKRNLWQRLGSNKK